LLDGKVYTGKHEGSYNSNYLGSGIHLKRAIKKHGRENFSVPKIITWSSNQKDLDNQEKYWINESLTTFGRENVYNIGIGGKGGDNITLNPNKEQICKNLRLNHADFSGKNNPAFGNTRIVGKRNPNFGSHKFLGTPFRTVGYKFMHNPDTQEGKYTLEKETINWLNKGWIFGRRESTKQNMRKPKKRKKPNV